MKHILLSMVFLLSVFSQSNQECISRDYGLGGTVCVCNSEECDTISRPEILDAPQYYIYTSNKAGLRFQQEIGEFYNLDYIRDAIFIERGQKYQTVLGFGGAFTDSTGINIASLDEDLQEKLLRSYFSEDGIEYSLCRVPIGGTDFSTHGYSYDDGEADPELTNFALADEDHKYKIPYIKKALELTDNNLEFFASAWTAPKWMKTNGEYASSGFIKNEYYQTWADYFVKFLDSYNDQGIKFWGLTTGNEPHDFVLVDTKLNNVGWVSLTMSKWIDDNLGPAIRQSNYSNIKIMTLDDQRFWLPWFADLLFLSNTTRDYVDGIAVHWYADYAVPPTLLESTHENYPEKFILNTEACGGYQSYDQHVMIGSWERGENYTADIIEDFSHWVGGWVDWNMALDEQGGPTYIDNFVDSPIIVNATAGEFYKQPMFYHLGHFSKFVPKGSIRIGATVDLEDLLKVIVFQRPDNGTTLVILNRSEEVIETDLIDDTRGIAQLELSARSVTTILYW